MKGRKTIRGSTELEKKFIRNFDQLCERQPSWQVWQDFLEMSACAIANAVDRRPDVWESREASYMDTVKKYSKEELNLLCEMFGITTLALEENPAQDFLGKFYMLLDFGKGWHGQFFTPWHIAEFMSRIQMDDSFQERCASEGYISVNDPCCGSGCMLMAYANACKDAADVNYQQSVFFVGQDIDPTVAKMCYIQISLLGCPGYVIVGNSLTEPIHGSVLEPIFDKPENIWFTPLYFTDLWTLRRMKGRGERPKQQKETAPVQEIHRKENTLDAMQKAPKAKDAVKRVKYVPPKRRENKKKPFSWEEFFTVKRRDKK